VTLADLRIDVLILVCAVSAGIHGALVPEHFDEGTGAGLGFVAATVLLAVIAVALTRAPRQLTVLATAAVLAGLIASYALVITTGFPVLHPDVEAVDGLALFTKAIEVLGLALAAVALAQPKGIHA
jgi:drug/metabolite transporter (DMT)-like permease